ncbi:MAG: HD domain-containing phosphohydrolase, partial [Phycisphaerae bacterium]
GACRRLGRVMKELIVAGASNAVLPDPSVGRLPSHETAWPLSERRFRRLAEHWRGFGVWLSLWQGGGRMIACDESAGDFWNTLRHGEAFVAELARLAAETMSHPPANTAPLDWGPWSGVLGLVAAPVKLRRRCVGAVLGAFVIKAAPSEEWIRLWDRLRLDRETLTRFLARTPVLSADSRAHVLATLPLTVEQAREVETRDSEIVVLTQNLETTYEELHLVYEISRHMGIPQEPVRMLETVGRQLLEVARAACIGFVLSEGDDRNAAAAAQDGRARGLADRAVQVGRGAPALEDLARLADCLWNAADRDSGHLLMNRAGERPELKWASTWLRHLVAVPLSHEGRTLGLLLALNCVDDRDYTSVDIQLLRAVGDRVTAALRNQLLYDDLADLLMGLLHALVNSVDAKDPYTFGHSERVAFLSRALARAAGMSPIECERTYLAGLLHDVGKIGVPDAILCKPGRLTREEFDRLKKHPEIGERILAHVRQIRDLMPGVLHHHERMDGRGYPHGLVGRNIPLLGRIICLADSFDAMTTNRTYRAALPVLLAIGEIRRCSGSQFDPALAETFLGLDLEGLFQAAHARENPDPEIGRIGALCAALEGSLRSPSAEHPSDSTSPTQGIRA